MHRIICSKQMAHIRRGYFLWVIMTLLLGLTQCSHQKPVGQIHRKVEHPVIHVYLYNDYPSAKVNIYVRALKKVYPYWKIEQQRLRLPDYAFAHSYKVIHGHQYKRYWAMKLLYYLSRYYPKDGYILGITDEDIVIYKKDKNQWTQHGIFGLTNMRGERCMIVSTIRGEQNDGVKERLMMHEMGHAFGLPHCPNACIMHDAHGHDIFIYLKTFCPHCKNYLQSKGWNL
jgi:predicted Zn-dependent protease